MHKKIYDFVVNKISESLHKYIEAIFQMGNWLQLDTFILFMQHKMLKLKYFQIT